MTTSATTAAPRTTYKSVFAVRDFRVLFGAVLMYIMGFQFEILGLSVLVYVETRSAFLASLAFSIGFAPQAVGGALFTSVAGRLAPRTAIVSGLIIRSAPGLVIGSWPTLPIPVMLALVAVAATAAPVFTASVSGLLPDVLDGDRYVLGRSIFSLTNSSSQIIGLAVGGGVLAALPARWLLLAAGSSLAISAAITGLGLQHRRTSRNKGAAKVGSIMRATLAGNIELLANARVRGQLLARWMPAWFITAAESLVVPYVESQGHSASAASPLLAVGPIGMLVGDVVIGRFCRPTTRERLAFPLAVLMGIPLLAIILHPPLLVVGACLFVTGFGWAYQLGIQRAFLESLPQALRSQAFGLNATGLMGGQGLFPAAAGALAAAFGAGAAMAAAGAITIVAAVALHGSLTSYKAPPEPRT